MAHVLPLSVEEISGLTPQAWVSIGAGYSREDVKAALLGAPDCKGFVGEAVSSLTDIARNLISSDLEADRVLAPTARQEVLRALLKDRRIAQASGGFPELTRLKRQARFLKKLDMAIQAGRMSFAHEEEEQVYLERLSARLGAGSERAVQSEVRTLSIAYVGILEAYGLWDQALLYQKATARLEQSGWPDEMRRPKKIYFFSNQLSENRERAFLEALGRFVEIVIPGTSSPAVMRPKWQRWHTLDDAVEGMFDEILEAGAEPHSFSILIPDQAEIRRTLLRAIAERGLPLADPRDPSRVRWDESIKWAMLPLELVGRDFERDSVISYCSGSPEFRSQAVIEDINNRGIRQGLSFYRGGKLVGLHTRLEELMKIFGGKKTLSELSEAHLNYILKQGANAELSWMHEFFKRFWDSYLKDLKLLEFLEVCDKKMPLRLWLERVQQRLQDATPPADALKATQGVEIFRLSQAPTHHTKQLWIFGMPADFLSNASSGDYWWSEREREVLGAEFSVRSSVQVRDERIAALRAWCASTEKLTILDAHYDYDGAERESLQATFRELAPVLGAEIEPSEMGAHRRWLQSFSALRPVQPQEVRLPPLPRGVDLPTLSATALDHYSRCAFQGLAFHRWKLQNQRDPDTELWPEVRGNILHQAVKHLLKTRDLEGNFTLTPFQALELGWKEKPPRGLMMSPRVVAYNKSRMLRVLEVFCEKEREYFNKTHATPISLDERSLRLEFQEFAVVGTPDRIDKLTDGLFIMDYKSKSVVPNGSDMLEMGYCLQLPFYALAAAQQMDEPVVGLQFIQLIPKGTRSSGLFFKKYNGKEPGKITQLTRASKSLLEIEPAEAFSELHEQIEAHAQAYLAGVFDAHPKKRDKECTACSVSDLCGFKRLIQVSGEDEGGRDDAS